MNKKLTPEVVLENLGPEVKSYIYQIILEFEPFTTPETVVSVVAKNPLDLIKFGTPSEYDTNSEVLIHSDHGELPKKTVLKKMFRIEISLTDEGHKIQAEGLHENIFEAINSAKNKLIKTLIEIQNDIISNQDRHAQIQQVLAAGGSLH
jgi:ribosome-associated translation inhibitor RaiA